MSRHWRVIMIDGGKYWNAMGKKLSIVFVCLFIYLFLSITFASRVLLIFKYRIIYF